MRSSESGILSPSIVGSIIGRVLSASSYASLLPKKEYDPGTNYRRFFGETSLYLTSSCHSTCDEEPGKDNLCVNICTCHPFDLQKYKPKPHVALGNRLDD